MELNIYRTESGISCYNAGNSVTDHMLPISRAIYKLLASHSMPLTNGYSIIIYDLHFSEVTGICGGNAEGCLLGVLWGCKIT